MPPKIQLKYDKSQDSYYIDCGSLDNARHVLNLTSDAEGEEMLTVPRKKVKEKWQRACEQEAKYGRAQDSPVAREELYYNRGILSILDTLFGTKCLPDELNEDNFAKSEPKPAEPKFKVGDKVRIVDDNLHNYKHKGEVTEIVSVDKSDIYVPYKVDIYDEEFGGGLWYSESDLEPYTEPTSTFTDDCKSQCKSHHIGDANDMIDDIIKNSFREHNRLHIAAQIVAAIYANNQAAKDFKSIEEIVRKALDIADTLIKESEKGGVAN